MEAYGQELIIDVHRCRVEHTEASLHRFCLELCDAIDMTTEDFHTWASEPDESKDPKTFGISAIQFLLTSNITVHWLPLRCEGSLLLNVFSCRSFGVGTVIECVREYFPGILVNQQVVERF
jgi:hypothetical protein